MTKVTLENISHSYDGGKTWAVSGINLSFDSGHTYAFLGPSGCGKSTILKIIAGVIRPTKGRILFNDVDVTDYPLGKRNVGIVFQFPVVYRMSVLDNLLFPLMNVKMPKSEKIKKARHIAELVGIENILDMPAQKLGPADRQRVSIGRVLMKDADIILFDEPMSSIEPDKRYGLKKLLMNIVTDLKKTMIYVTHDQTEALTLGEKIAVMSGNGRLLQFGTPDEIYYSPANEFICFFIGFPGMNIIDGRVIDEGVDLGPFKLILNENKPPLNVNEQVKVGIRPEHVHVSSTSKEGYVPFDVVYEEDLGRELTILHLRNQEVFIKVRTSTKFSNMSKVWVKIPEKHILFFDKSGNRIS